MIFNIVSGGFTATIVVYTAPWASVTCALSPFSYTLTADGNGYVAFTVHAKGAWTCSSSRDGVFASETANVTTPNSTVTVNLPLKVFIFREGSGAVMPLFIRDSSNRCNYNNDRISLYNYVYIASGGSAVKVNLSSYSKVCMDCVETASSQFGCCVSDSINTGSVTMTRFDAPTRMTHVEDISGITGSKYIGVYYGSSKMGTVYNWWFEV